MIITNQIQNIPKTVTIDVENINTSPNPPELQAYLDAGNPMPTWDGAEYIDSPLPSGTKGKIYPDGTITYITSTASTIMRSDGTMEHSVVRSFTHTISWSGTDLKYALLLSNAGLAIIPFTNTPIVNISIKSSGISTTSAWIASYGASATNLTNVYIASVGVSPDTDASRYNLYITATGRWK